MRDFNRAVRARRSPMTVSSHDVAEELRRRLQGVGVVKLHKLLYYAQGWHLTWAGEPMFDEAIEAWGNGPVVAGLWADEKHERGRPEPRALHGDHLATLDHVIGRYGCFTGKELIRMTHQEDPWRDVSESDDPWDVVNPEITNEAMQRWFERDDEYAARSAEVARLRERSGTFSFAPIVRTQDLEAAVGRAVTGERVRHIRPS